MSEPVVQILRSRVKRFVNRTLEEDAGGGVGGKEAQKLKTKSEKKRLQGKDSLKMGMRNTQVAPLLCILF